MHLPGGLSARSTPCCSCLPGQPCSLGGCEGRARRRQSCQGLRGLVLRSGQAVPRVIVFLTGAVPLGKGEVELKTSSQNVIHAYFHLFWHPFLWAQTKSKDTILSSGGHYLRMMFLLKKPWFWDFYMFPEKRLQYMRAYINMKQRKPNTWTPFRWRPSHSSMLGLFCNVSLIRKCWKCLILALNQRQWSCLCASLSIMWRSAAWQFTNQIYVAIEYGVFWKLCINVNVCERNYSRRFWKNKKNEVWWKWLSQIRKLMLCRQSDFRNSLSVKLVKININSLLGERLRWNRWGGCQENGLKGSNLHMLTFPAFMSIFKKKLMK